MKLRFFRRELFPGEGMGFVEEKAYLCSDYKTWTSHKEKAGIFTDRIWDEWGRRIEDLEYEELSQEELMRAMNAPELPL